jgi:hypothetical protein
MTLLFLSKPKPRKETMYKIVSPRVGTPGDEFVPVAGVNLDALIAGGFIIEVGKPKTTKPKGDNITTDKESE